MAGYKTITPIQLANIVWALKNGQIEHKALRVYFACFLLLAIRESAGRYQKARGEKPKLSARYRTEELQSTTGLGQRAVKRALRSLERAELLQFCSHSITPASCALPGSQELLQKLSCRRSPKRPIPIPRSMLSFLTKSTREAVTKTALAYFVRGLSLSKEGGVVSHKGTVKVSWISETLTLSRRSVIYARKLLIGAGWFERDRGSHQLKLNRDGAYFVLNLCWSEKGNENSRKNGESGLVNPHNPDPQFAPRPPQKCAEFAPPYENKKSSNENKNQKTCQTKPDGFFSSRFSSIKLQDLSNFTRLEALYFDAVKSRIICASEAGALNFIAAAVRSREAGREPVKLFSAIVRRRLWHHITQAQEEYARKVLTKFRNENQNRFRACAFAQDKPRTALQAEVA